jgi:hypothetical protein
MAERTIGSAFITGRPIRMRLTQSTIISAVGGVGHQLHYSQRSDHNFCAKFKGNFSDEDE